jgi:glutathione S-transferase
MILYDFDLSAECYAVRLLAAILGIPVELRRVDVFPGREHEEADFLALNPLGTVPVLVAGERILYDWQAMLAFLAARSKHRSQWWPEGEPRLIEWLGLARRLETSVGLARAHYGMGVETDVDRCRGDAHRLLRVLDRHLWFAERDGRAWLLPGRQPTAADIAVFVHVVLSEEGDIERMDYPAVRRWTDRVREIDGFIPMSGVFPPLKAMTT